MNGTAYGFLTAAAPGPDALTRALAEAFAVPQARVDVAPDGTVDGRNWDTALVTCEYEVLRAGDLRGMVQVYATPAVTAPPAPEEVAAALARESGTSVLVEWGTVPWVRKVFLPQGWTTYAAIEDLDIAQDQPWFRVYATQTGLAAFPEAEVEGLPATVHGVPAHTPLADALGEHRDLLHPWEALISRMAAGWPPARWYGADLYRADLEARDRLEAALPTLPDAVRTALTTLDARFHELTIDDAGEELGADPSVTPWYRHRRPAVLPWRVLLPADPEAADWLWKWVEEGAEGKPGGVDLSSLDLSGADLSGADLSSSLLCAVDLTRTRLHGTDFHRSNLQSADLTGADATGACFVRADLDGAVLRGTTLDGADLTRADLYGADARGATLRGACLLGATLIDTDLRGADLTGARLGETSFRVTLDDTTRVTGLTGTLTGPTTLTTPAGTPHPLTGPALEHWLRTRGSNARVVPPRHHRQAGDP
ncbi:pentapeptide repeat-containing protein [Streptomyces racemochromogenes]|uniref:Pentapeptide repeat-containing protein n=1 Tax=Streptomyces racemochromogenes TaxID=67353 RepID=A0ABW7PMX6_9ACTN